MTNKFNYMKCGGFDYFENTKILNNKEIKFHTLDISGWITSHKVFPERFLRNSDGIILMFSLYKERESFLALYECYQLIENVISDDLSNFPILLIGAKADENERVTNSKEA